MKIIKDPDDTWHAYVDWNDWVNAEQTKLSGTITITGSTWTPNSVDIVEESGTPTDDESNISLFFGSGGTAGVDYKLVNQITYTLVVGSTTKTGLTKSKTIPISVREQ